MSRLPLLLAAGFVVIAAAIPAVAGSAVDENGVPSLLNDGNSAAENSAGVPAYTVDQPAYRAGPTEPDGTMRLDLGTGDAKGAGFVVPAPISPDPRPDLPGQPSRH